MRLISILLLALLSSYVASHKILVYNSQYGHSHSNFLGNIADILVDAGHDVTSFIPIIDPTVKDGTSKSKKVFLAQSKETKQFLDEMMEHKADFFSMNNFDAIVTFFVSKVFAKQFVYQCKAVIEEKELLKKFQAEKFDVMIVENFDMCGVGYAHLVKPKSLITSGASSPFSYMFEEFGVPTALSYNPSSYMSSLNVHSMADRAWNIYADFLMHAIFYPGRWMIEELYREKIGADFPSLQEISSHAAYTLVNSEPLIDFATPTLNRVIPIGGIGAKAPKPLDKYWNEVLSRRSKTILLSFGSVAKSVYLPDAVKQSILTTIGSFPEVTFIWKYEEPEDDFGKSATAALPNLVLSSWMPQNDLLNDERITLFITHGGMGSTQETALRGRPGIFIPIFGDQPRNAGMMQHNGFGKVIDKFDLHKPEVVIAAIKEILGNESYKKNAARISKMLAKKPFTSKEQLIKTIEFAGEYGPSRALRPQSYDMTFIEYHNLDICAAFIVFSLLSLFITKKFLCCLYKKCCGSKKEEKKSKKDPSMRLLSLLLLVALASEVASYKILVYNSKYGHSHSNFLGNIADLLVDAGHDVTSFIPIIETDVKDGTSKSKKVYVQQAKETKELLDAMAVHKADFFSMNNFDLIIHLIMPKMFASQFLFQCKAVVEEREILEKFQAEKFDVMIVENFDMCGVGYAHLIKPKALITSGASTPFSYMFEEFGIPLSPSYNPSSAMSSFNVHSMFDRAKNIYAEFLSHLLFYPGRWMIEDLYREKFGADFPSMQEISSHAAYTLVNSEPLIDYAAPTLNRVIPIGGIGAKPPKPVDKYWDEVLSRRSRTILLSFGSIAKSVYLPEGIKQSILTTIGAFPDVTFIWKYEEPEDAFGKAASAAHPNLVLSSWMPQNDLLGDERLTLFITHGGMGSTQETALRGKPGIFIPIFGDQPRNAGMMQHNGFGKVIDKFDLPKPEVVIAAIKEILGNDSYRKNAERISKMLAKKPFTSKEQLIKTIEFAAEYGPSRALRPQSYDMTFIEYHNLDICAAFILLSLISLHVTKKLMCCLYKKCCGAKKEEKKSKKE